MFPEQTSLLVPHAATNHGHRFFFENKLRYNISLTGMFERVSLVELQIFELDSLILKVHVV